MRRSVVLQVGQTSEALNAARKEVEQADRDAAAVAKKADDLTAAAGQKSKEAEEYRCCSRCMTCHLYVCSCTLCNERCSSVQASGLNTGVQVL